MIKAAMVTPNLSLGGAERWLVDLITHTAANQQIKWTGVAVSSFGGLDRRLAQELYGKVPIFANKRAVKVENPLPFDWSSVDRPTSPDFRETVKQACCGADVVVTWGNPHLGFWFENVRAPVICCSHTTLKESPLQPISGVHALAAVSEAAMTYFDGRMGGVLLTRRVIYNGVNPNRVSMRYRKEETLCKWGLQPGTRLVGFLGRQSPEKNPQAAADACRELPEEYVAAYVGNGINGCTCSKRLQEYCERYLPGRHLFKPPEPHVGDILRAFDVLMLASHREAFSLTSIEAWMTETPVLATPAGAIPELEAKYGPLTIHLPFNANPKALAKAVRFATGSSPLIRQILNNAHQLAWTELTIDDMTNHWVDYLKEIA